jgi:Gluconate 2-dehydrogenase subunit 3
MARKHPRRRTGTTPGSSEQRFPGYDVLGQSNTWDTATSAVVLGRLVERKPLSFFSEDQKPVARALLDRLLAQNDEPRVPVIEMIDERLGDRRGDGYRYEEMPDDWEAWSRSIDAIDRDAKNALGKSFADIEIKDQMELVEQVRLRSGDWYGLPAKRVFQLWMRYACDAYYSHPWAWNEIGFGGPAYPRGYKNLGIGKREPWEVEESDASDPIPWADRVEKARAQHVATSDERPDQVSQGPYE